MEIARFNPALDLSSSFNWWQNTTNTCVFYLTEQSTKLTIRKNAGGGNLVWQPIAQSSMEIDDEPLLRLTEQASLEVRPQVVRPPEPAALTAPEQPRELGDRAPAAMAIGEDEVDELLVLLPRPGPLLHSQLITAWTSPHLFRQPVERCGATTPLYLELPPNSPYFDIAVHKHISQLKRTRQLQSNWPLFSLIKCDDSRCIKGYRDSQNSSFQREFLIVVIICEVSGWLCSPS